MFGGCFLFVWLFSSLFFCQGGSGFGKGWRSVTVVLVYFLLVGSCEVSSLCLFIVFFSSVCVKCRMFVCFLPRTVGIAVDHYIQQQKHAPS